MSYKDKKSVTSAAFDYIREQIKKGEWKKGEKIPSEPKLCTSLNISRSALREVLQQFGAFGIIKSEQGRGTFVISTDVNRLMSTSPKREAEAAGAISIEDALNYRCITEPSSLKLAVAAGNRMELIDRLSPLLSQMSQSLLSTDAFVQADNDFHLAIAQASGNRLIYDNLLNLMDMMRSCQRHINNLFGFKEGLEAHCRIVSLLTENNIPAAVAVLEEHLKTALLNLKEQTESSRRINIMTGTQALDMAFSHE